MPLLLIGVLTQCMPAHPSPTTCILFHLARDGHFFGCTSGSTVAEPRLHKFLRAYCPQATLPEVAYGPSCAADQPFDPKPYLAGLDAMQLNLLLRYSWLGLDCLLPLAEFSVAPRCSHPFGSLPFIFPLIPLLHVQAGRDHRPQRSRAAPGQARRSEGAVLRLSG